MEALDGFVVGDSVRRKSKAFRARKVGVIVALIPAVEYPYYAAHPAKARVCWPDHTRIGGNGYSHSTINLSALVKDEAMR